MTDSQQPPIESAPTTDPTVVAAKQRRRRIITVSAIGVGVIALVVVLIFALGGDDTKISAADDPTTSVIAATSTPATTKVTTATTTVAATTTSTTDVPTTSTTEAPTTTEAATTTTELATTTTASPTTSAVPVTVAPATPPITPVTAVAGGNCSIVGTISIPATNTFQTIIAETKQFTDGLLCGNHKSDHIEQGVDVLPGFAPFDASVAGGSALIGQRPAIIFGHRNSHNRPFVNINTLQAGDDVIITNLNGTTIALKVDTVVLLPVAEATVSLLSPSVDGAPQIRLVACSHADGTPGGVNYRWVATLSNV